MSCVPCSRRRDSGRGWTPILLYDTQSGLSPQRDCYWSTYYAAVKRAPHVTSLAPWVSA